MMKQQYSPHLHSAIFVDILLGARRFRAEADTSLYEADMSARTLFYIHEGQVRTYRAGRNDSASVLEILGPGEWFGVPALARRRGIRYGSRAVAMTASTISEVPAARLLAALPNHPAVAWELLSQLSSTLQRLWARDQSHLDRHHDAAD